MNKISIVVIIFFIIVALLIWGFHYFVHEMAKGFVHG